MKGMRLGAALLALLLSCVPAFAAEEARASERDVARLMELTQVDQMFAAMRGQVAQAMSEGARAGSEGKLSEAQQQILEKYMKRMANLMFSEEASKRLLDLSSRIYMDHFTTREVQDMIRFYESETGRAVTRKMPLVMQQSMQIGMQWAESLKPQIEALMEEMKAELQQAEPDPRGLSRQP